MKIGIIGLPASGKTTLFNALTGGSAKAGGYGQVHLGVARVADPRVDALSEIFRPKKTTYATVNFADVPALEGSESSRSAGEAIPPALEGADALLLAVRGFEDPGVPHPRQTVDPARDLEDARLELIIRDLSVVERRADRLEEQVRKRKDPDEAAELELLRSIRRALEEGKPVSAVEFSGESQARLRGFGFLSSKPLLVVINAGEDHVGADPEAFGMSPASGEAAPIVLCGKLEEELAQLPDDELASFLEDYGIAQAAAERVIRASFSLLGLQCFMTVGEDEVRAWPIREGTSAVRAAGTIHSDLERGFIRAEVISYADFMEAGSMAAARERGSLRLEGKDYLVQDGDILHVRFNV
ncbi:MAG: DUF933 domain-containing protein [bacterium]|nr:DUF933 domain-containing protein [bacterium]